MKITLYFILLLNNFLFAQLPDTDIFLFDVKCTAKTMNIISYKNITNRKGYDNQPYFHPNNLILYFVSIKEDNQSDIYFYDLSKKAIFQFTKTSISEYSPQLTPDKKFISCVVVEADSTQKIYQYDVSGNKNGTKLMEEDSIAYYSWINKDSIVFYKLTKPHSLNVVNLLTGKNSWITDEPARSFAKINNNHFFYVIKEKDTSQVRIYSALLKKSEEYALTGKLNEDFIWQEPFGLLKTENKKIYRYDTGFELWIELLDLSKYTNKKISRFSISHDNKHLAVVVHDE